jgi:hypothetical protein
MQSGGAASAESQDIRTIKTVVAREQLGINTFPRQRSHVTAVRDT